MPLHVSLEVNENAELITALVAGQSLVATVQQQMSLRQEDVIDWSNKCDHYKTFESRYNPQVPHLLTFREAILVNVL